MRVGGRVGCAHGVNSLQILRWRWKQPELPSEDRSQTCAICRLLPAAISYICRPVLRADIGVNSDVDAEEMLSKQLVEFNEACSHNILTYPFDIFI